MNIELVKLTNEYKEQLFEIVGIKEKIKDFQRLNVFRIFIFFL